MTEAKGTAMMKNWEEHTWDGKRYDEVTGPKQTTGTSTYAYSGDLEGVGESRFLMAYPDGESCSTVALEVVTGTLGGRSGAFVLQHVGGYRDGVAEQSFTVVASSGGLAGLRGRGRVTWAMGEPGQYAFDYEV